MTAPRQRLPSSFASGSPARTGAARAWLVCACLAAAVGAGPAQAAGRAGKRTAMVLVRTEGPGAQAYVDVLRAAAEAALPEGTRAVPPPAVEVDEAAMAVGCSWSLACAAELARANNANAAVAIEVTQAEALTLRLATASGKNETEWRTLTVSPEVSADLRLEVAKAFVAPALLGASPVALVVQSDVAGARVLVDGTEVGTTPLTSVGQLEAGPHSVAVSFEGAASAAQEVTLTAGETAVLTFAGAAQAAAPAAGPAVAPPPTQAAAGFSSTQTVGAVLGGAGALAVLGGGAFSVAWLSAYNEAAGAIARGEPLRRCVGLCTDDGLGLGVSGKGRADLSTGGFTAYVGAGVSVLGLGAIGVAVGSMLLLSGAPSDVPAASPAAE